MSPASAARRTLDMRRWRLRFLVVLPVTLLVLWGAGAWASRDTGAVLQGTHAATESFTFDDAVVSLASVDLATELKPAYGSKQILATPGATFVVVRLDIVNPRQEPGIALSARASLEAGGLHVDRASTESIAGDTSTTQRALKPGQRTSLQFFFEIPESVAHDMVVTVRLDERRKVAFRL